MSEQLEGRAIIALKNDGADGLVLSEIDGTNVYMNDVGVSITLEDGVTRTFVPWHNVLFMETRQS